MLPYLIATGAVCLFIGLALGLNLGFEAGAETAKLRMGRLLSEK